MCGSDLHLLVDGARPDVECAAEDEGEAEDVVDLIRVIGASRGHDDVLPDVQCDLRQDLRVGIRHGEDDRIVRHAGHHLPRQHARRGQADEDAGAFQDIRQRAKRCVLGEPRLVGIEIVATSVDNARAINHEDVLAQRAQRDKELRAGDGGCPGSVDDDADRADRSVSQVHGVEQCGARDDRRAVLVIVKDRDAQPLLERFFYVEALGRPYVLKVDTSDRGLQQFAETDHVVRVFTADLEVEDVDVRELLEQDGLPFHHGLGGGGSDLAESEHRRAV